VLRELHQTFAWIVIISNALLGIWFAAAQRWPVARTRWMWWPVIPAQIAVIIQAVIGASLASQPGIVLDDMHALYGFSAIVAIGILYSYRSSPFIRDRQYMLYGIGSLFIMGLGIRNLYLGH
jgi:hypothetical protein